MASSLLPEGLSSVLFALRRCHASVATPNFWTYARLDKNLASHACSIQQRARSSSRLMLLDKRSHGTYGRNPLLREKTKAIRTNVLEVIYGGKDKIPEKVSWVMNSEDANENGVSEDDVNVPVNGEDSLVKQRAFLKESNAYQASSVEFISILQGKREETCLEKADSFLHCLHLTDKDQDLSQNQLSEGIHHLCGLSGEDREQRLASSVEGILGHQVCRCMSDMTTEEFVECLLVFHWWEIPLLPHQNSLIEKECLRRMSSWDVNTLLLVSDWWIRKSGATSWKFHEEMVLQLRQNWTKLSAHQTVQAFYLCGQYKRPAQDLVEKLTLLAERLVDELSLTEIATICYGLVKSAGRLPKNTLLPSTISAALSKTSQLQTDLDLYNVVTILRFLGRSYYYDSEVYHKVAEFLVPHLPKMEAVALPHIASVYARARLVHRPLLDGILNYFDHSKANLKDYYLTLWAFCRLNYTSEDFVRFTDKAILGITEEETWAHTGAFFFVKTLLALTYTGVYPRELLNRAFSQAYLRNYKDRCPPDVYKHLYCVDCSLGIESPDYCGNRLPKSVAEQSDLVPHGSAKAVMNENKEIAQVTSLLRELLEGPEFLVVHPILDHIRTPVDIEVHLDHSGNPVSLCEQNRDGESCTKLAVLIAPEAHCVRDSHTLLGVHVMKRRQLKIRGYQIVEIPFYEWQSVKKQSRAKRMEYLSQKLYNR